MGVADYLQYLNPVNLIKPKQSSEGMLLEHYVKSGVLRHDAVGELMQRQRQGASSAQLLQEIRANKEKYFIKSDEERQLSQWKAKQLFEQQAEEQERTRQQGQSQQVESLFRGFIQPPQQPPLPGAMSLQLPQQPPQLGGGASQQGLPGVGRQPPLPGAPSQGGQSGIASRQPGQSGLGMFSPPSLSLPQQQFSTGVAQQIPQMGVQPQALPSGGGQLTPQEAYARLYGMGLGPTDPEALAGIISELFPTPTATQQEQMMRNEELRRFVPGSPQRRQELLSKTTPTAQQDRAAKLEREKFTYQQEVDSLNRKLDITKLNFKFATQKELMKAKNDFTLALEKFRQTNDDRDAKIAIAKLIRQTAKDVAGEDEVTREHVIETIGILSDIMPDTFGVYTSRVEKAEPGFLGRMWEWLFGKSAKLKSSAIVSPRIDASKKDDLDTILEIQ